MDFLKVFVNLFHFNRTNWKAVALCFLAAAIFWLFNALNKSYSTNIRFPLHLEYDTEKFAPASPLPQSIMINVNGTGWDLLRKYFGVRLPVLTIPVNRPADTKKIVASTLPPLLSSQIGSTKINHMMVDTVRLDLEPRIYRKFKLVVDTAALQFREGSGRLSAITITPDSVDLSGPISMIHDTPDPIVLTLPAKKMGNNFREEVEVSIPDQDYIQRNPPVVEVAFTVGEMSVVEKWATISNDRLPWGYVGSKDSVKAVFLVPTKVADSFAKATVHATLPQITSESLKRGEVKSYLPKVVALPPFAELISIDSVEVKHF